MFFAQKSTTIGNHLKLLHSTLTDQNFNLRHYSYHIYDVSRKLFYVGIDIKINQEKKLFAESPRISHGAPLCLCFLIHMLFSLVCVLLL